MWRKMSIPQRAVFITCWWSSFLFLSCQEKRAPEEQGTQTLDWEVPRDLLELRDGRLYRKNETTAFNGILIERFPGGQRKARVEIRDGKPHGRSQGWYENGTLEVEETFTEGISHGERTRWYETGTKKSVAQIEQGQLHGTFSRYYESGQLAQQAETNQGEPHGLSQAWHPSGKLKARVEMHDGEVVTQEFFED